ncbi:MAG TPA: HAD family hydrolase [Candidatus Competibacteraceae bacterium]|nr:MAG: HAD family hydrolase [Candidatus Competibacteraceae bacterium]HOB61855.1 HAD family hydrolase [Candidatus Competibacteraceae bacterium]HQA25419.1 HAD family hydrolase [Candidatus Competibacteraceae bacterium]HQD56089.1 HAD family hydrolase [Candidatus Competibacteraceae bacterium]
MSLALFDLDNTLLEGDSDYLWGRFLIEQGIVDGEYYERENQRFYDEYRNGVLDIYQFLAFMLQPLAEHPLEQLLAWRERFLAEKIEPILLPKAVALLERHRTAGDTLLIITATNRFITAPIAERLGVAHLLATEVEFVDGRYTGRPLGIPCFQQGKVERLNAWLAETGHDLADSWFYSDSHNDLPLLGQVTHPVVVDPDPILHEQAQARGWPIISLRETAAA